MKALVLDNPYSGYKKMHKNIEYIKHQLSTKYKEVDIFTSNKTGSLTKKICDSANSYDLVVICGGDGTLNECVNALMLLVNKPTIAYIPCGTVNDFGRNLGLKKQKLKHSIDNILNGSIVEMDLCKIEKKYFLYAHAIGKYTDVPYKTSNKLKNKIGKIAYFLEAIKHLPKTSKMQLTITANNTTLSGDYYVLLTLNTQRIAGFKFHRKEQIKLNDGLIDLTLIKKQKALSFFNLLLFFLLGDRKKGGIITIKSNKFHIKLNDALPHNIDGEHAFDSDNVNIEVVPKCLKIIVNNKIKKHFF